MAETAHTNSTTGDTLAAYIATMDERLSDRSKQEYTNRLRELRAKLDEPGDTLTPAMLLSAIRKLTTAGEAADSTMRTYKSAVKYWLAQQAQAQVASGGDYSVYASAFEELQSLKYVRNPAAPRRGASLKLKHFPDECVAALAAYAADRGSRAATIARALAFVRANLLVGLRPAEWFNAAFISYLPRTAAGDYVRTPDGQLVFEHGMTVDNAKATHGRANGERRELQLLGINPEELTTLMNFSRLVQEFAARFPPGTDPRKLSDAFFRPVNTAIRRAMDAAGFGARDIPSVYSTRHQVVADFKASDVSEREITAWFGHYSEATHKKHYGRKRHGRGDVKFRPTPESVANVAAPGLGRRDHNLIPDHVRRNAADWAKSHETRHVSTPRESST